MIHLREKSHDGYSLIECLIYCCLVGFLIITFIPVTIRFAGSVSRLGNINHDLISFCVATDLFYRDLKQHTHQLHILSIASDTLIWRCGDQSGCIGWSVHDGYLVRTEGDYVEITKSWKDSKQSIICNSVITGLFSVDQSTHPIKVLLRLTFRHDRTMERVIWI